MGWRLALVGIGTAIFIPPNSAAAMSAIPDRHRGIAAGTVATARNLGMVLGVCLAELIFNSIFRNLSGGVDMKAYRPEMEPFFMAAFQIAMLGGCMTAGVGAAVSFLRGPEKSRPPE